MVFSVTSSEMTDLTKITEFYYKMKQYLLMAEEADKDRKTNPQILIELRNALDHLMRFLAAKLKIKTNVTEDYEKKTLDKVFSHVYRTGYDVLDWLSIDLRDKIDSLMKKYSH